MAEGRVGKGVLQVTFDRGQIERAGKETLLPSAQRLAGDVASLFAATKLIDFGKAGFEELKRAQAVTAQTEAQLRLTGNAAGVTAEQIDQLGLQMENLAGFDDEAARSAANVLLRLNAFKGIEGLKRVEGDAADLAVTLANATGAEADLAGASEILGKALAAPDKASRLLRPIIGALTAEQQASIKAFQDQGNAAGAQNVILQAVEERVKGTAAAYGQTLPGQINRASEAWKDAKAQVVGGFAPAIELGARVTTAFAHTISGLPEPVREAVGGVVLLGGTIGTLVSPVSDLLNVLARLRTAQQASAAASSASAAATVEVAAAESVVDEASLRRVVTNEQVAFSDAEVASALQARQLAEYRTLVSNDALIASEEELATAMGTTATAGTASGAGLSAALGPVGLLAIAGLSLVNTLGLLDTGEHRAAGSAADFSQALREQNGVLDQNIDKVSLHTLTQDKSARGAADAGVSFGVMAAAIRGTSDDFGRYRKLTSDVGDDTALMADALKHAGAGSTEFGRALIDAGEHGRISADDFRGVIDTLESAHDRFVEQKAATDAETGALQTSGITAEDTAGSYDDLSAAMGGTTAASQELKQALDEQAQSRRNQLDAARGAFDAEQALSRADRGVEQAQRGVTEASRGVEQAQRRVADAYRSVGQAAERLADAEEALRKAQQPADAEDLGKAELAVSNAHLRTADAQSAVAKAEKDAANARKDGKHSAQESADLDRKVEEAKNDLLSAQYAEIDANKALQEVQAKGTDSDQAVIDAKKAVEDATQAVTDANQQLADSQNGVADAQQRVVDARQAVNDALVTQADAAATLKTKQDELKGGYVGVRTELDNLLTSFQNIDATLAPGSPERAHLDEYIQHLFVLAGIFNPQGAEENILGVHNPGVARASGGPLLPNQLFHGAEMGAELLVADSVYRAPNVASHVLTAAQTAELFAGRTSNDRPTIYAPIGNINNPVAETAGQSVGRELAILADKLELVG